jgi:hypothetical protein
MSSQEAVMPAASKNFVGIGKLFIDTLTEEWNMPYLHFLVDKAMDGHYEAVCLEFGLVSSGDLPEEVIKHLVAQVQFYIDAVMTKGNGYAEFIEAVESPAMNDFWTAYRKIEFTLAQSKQDLSHALDVHINKAIKQMILQKTEELITQIAKKQAQGIVDKALEEYKRLSRFISIEVKYSELRQAA